MVSGQVTQETEYFWDFGDGSTSTEENPEHTYTAAGVYTVTLEATTETSSNYGCGSNVMTRQICVG